MEYRLSVPEGTGRRFFLSPGNQEIAMEEYAKRKGEICKNGEFVRILTGFQTIPKNNPRLAALSLTKRD